MQLIRTHTSESKLQLNWIAEKALQREKERKREGRRKACPGGRKEEMQEGGYTSGERVSGEVEKKGRKQTAHQRMKVGVQVSVCQ